MTARGTLTPVPDSVVAPTTFGDLTFGAGVFGGSSAGQARPSLTASPSTRGTLS